MKRSYSKLHDRAMRRMFRVVGAHYSPAFVAQDDWFLKHTWTREQEDKFRDWLTDELRKIGVSRKRAAWEAGMFLVDRGWRREESK